jgi:hypothetical protein
VVKFLDIVKLKTLPAPVDCGTCPVNLACAVGKGGNGFVFDCCHATAFEMMEGEKRRLLVIDCQKHAFEQTELAKDCKSCPLCSGDIMEVVLRDVSQNNRYVPTVHAKVPLADRVKLFRTKLEEAKAILEEEKKRP